MSLLVCEGQDSGGMLALGERLAQGQEAVDRFRRSSPEGCVCVWRAGVGNGVVEGELGKRCECSRCTFHAIGLGTAT